MRRLILILILASVPTLLLAQVDGVVPRAGWRLVATNLAYADPLDRLRLAVPEEGLAVVTEAGPTEAARARGIEIPGNRVVGVFNNDVAVRVLGLSVAAMIEAPIRFYVTETGEGTATLSWKTPSLVFAPYAEEGRRRARENRDGAGRPVRGDRGQSDGSVTPSKLAGRRPSGRHTSRSQLRPPRR